MSLISSDSSSSSPIIYPNASGVLSCALRGEPVAVPGTFDPSWEIELSPDYASVAVSYVPSSWLVTPNAEPPSSLTVFVPSGTPLGAYRAVYNAVSGDVYDAYFQVTAATAPGPGPEAPVFTPPEDTSVTITAPNPLKSPFTSYRAQLYHPTSGVWFTVNPSMVAGGVFVLTGLTPSVSGYKLRFIGVGGGVEQTGAESAEFSTVASGTPGYGTTPGTYPLGKETSTAYKEHLAGMTTNRVLLYKILRRDGRIFAYTNHPEDINGSLVLENGSPIDELAGLTFRSSVGATPSDIKTQVTLDSDNMETVGLIRAEEISEVELMAGLFDGASVWICECNWRDLSMGIMRHVRGTLGEVQWDSQKFTASILALSRKLDQQFIPLTSTTCRVRQFGDARCKKNLLDNSEDGLAITKTGTITTVDATRTRHAFTSSDLTAYPENRLSYGRMKITSALSGNLNIWRKVKSNDNGFVVLSDPTPYEMANGDTFTIVSGCDRRMETCSEVYDNAVNFDGEPWLPGVSIYKSDI